MLKARIILSTRRPGRANPAGVVATLLVVLCASVPPSVAHRASQASLEGAATNLARMWERGSTDLFPQVLVASGIRLQVSGEDHISLSRRQAVAVLRDYLETHRTESTRLERVAEVGGSPLHGYAELRWAAVHEGASQLTEHSVYIGFVREDEVWRVFEVRVLQ